MSAAYIEHKREESILRKEQNWHIRNTDDIINRRNAMIAEEADIEEEKETERFNRRMNIERERREKKNVASINQKRHERLEYLHQSKQSSWLQKQMSHINDTKLKDTYINGEPLKRTFIFSAAVNRPTVSHLLRECMTTCMEIDSLKAYDVNIRAKANNENVFSMVRDMKEDLQKRRANLKGPYEEYILTTQTKLNTVNVEEIRPKSGIQSSSKPQRSPGARRQTVTSPNNFQLS